MPTMTIDSTALPSVLSAGMRPARNQIAVVTSMLLPLVSRVMSHWPRPVTSPAPSSMAMWSRGLAFRAASSSADGSATPQASSCTTLNSQVRAAAPRPAQRPVRTMAIQKRIAPGSRSVAGTFAPVVAPAPEEADRVPGSTARLRLRGAQVRGRRPCKRLARMGAIAKATAAR